MPADASEQVAIRCAICGVYARPNDRKCRYCGANSWKREDR